MTKFIVTHIPLDENLEKITQIFTNKNADKIFFDYMDQMKKNYCIYFEIIQIHDFNGEKEKQPLIKVFHKKYNFYIKNRDGFPPLP
jgi:hypothetical protein